VDGGGEMTRPPQLGDGSLRSENTDDYLKIIIIQRRQIGVKKGSIRGSGKRKYNSHRKPGNRIRSNKARGARSGNRINIHLTNSKLSEVLGFIEKLPGWESGPQRGSGRNKHCPKAKEKKRLTPIWPRGCFTK